MRWYLVLSTDPGLWVDYNLFEWTTFNWHGRRTVNKLQTYRKFTKWLKLWVMIWSFFFGCDNVVGKLLLMTHEAAFLLGDGSHQIQTFGSLGIIEWTNIVHFCASYILSRSTLIKDKINSVRKSLHSIIWVKKLEKGVRSWMYHFECKLVNQNSGRCNVQKKNHYNQANKK